MSPQVLYSLRSAACIINPDYADPSTFNHALDIFSTQSLTSAHIVETQFGQILPLNQITIRSYNSQQLNASYENIRQSISMDIPVSAGYLIGTLQASNATGPDPSSSGSGGNNTNPKSSSSGSSNKALSMLVFSFQTLFILTIFPGLFFMPSPAVFFCSRFNWSLCYVRRARWQQSSVSLR